MTQAIKLALLLTLAGVISACSLFSDDETEQPRELTDINEQFELERVWSVNVGDGQGEGYNRLAPAIDGDNIYAASADGTLMAINKETGRVLWRERTDLPITGGVGAASGLVLVGTLDARVVAFNQSSGEQMWTTAATSEVLAAPQTDGLRVVVQTIDGRLIGYDARDGERLWIYENTVPALSLRGTSKPLITGNRVIAGFANGLIAAVDITNGNLLWEERVAIPQGRYDIERIIDIDGNPTLFGGVVYVSSFQGNLMGLDVQTGRIVWGMAGSSYNALALGLGNIYWVDANSHVFAVQNNSERTVWENEDLRLRKVNSPVTFNNYLAVGDFEGYLHVLSQIDGQIVARTRIDRSGIRGEIISEGRNLYVFTNSGRLSALRLP
ncbi:MAG: outer membrane protein assembly factor BamB [Pseudomonadota bacterium]|nr:outer membrane protein assembly factor BamB [Gammaproteobacteria bacterium]MBJ56207.1 outer membrane protein assembly factor BamB [Gammaproteobacteria bacterium]MEC8859190.1 outer membrane protein assembly factor BamB [Pseudomonadota bacterium]|tara:strand:+ start:684 stop:1832 length:1149 start_codon:yes stop_codon:yes gene_type:complete